MATFKMSASITVKEVGRKSPAWSLEGDQGGEVTLKDFLAWRKEVLILISTEALRDEQRQGGFPTEGFQMLVDRRRKPLSEVSPFGMVEFIAPQSGSGILFEAYEGILRRSKIVTGNYFDSNLVVYNGNTVATTMGEFQQWLKTDPEFSPNDTVVFVNTAPYARKLERLGVTSQRTSSRTVKSRDKRGRSGPKILAPNGVYHLTFRQLKRKYKNNVKVDFNFIPGSAMGLGAKFKTPRGSGRGRLNPLQKIKSRTYLYPSIKITFQNFGGTL